jgi:hypothetical protein
MHLYVRARTLVFELLAESFELQLLGFYPGAERVDQLVAVITLGRRRGLRPVVLRLGR